MSEEQPTREREEELLVRLAANVIAVYSDVQDMPEETQLEEMPDIEKMDAELQQMIILHAERYDLDVEETMEHFANRGTAFLESGQYDQEMLEMLAEDGDLAEHIDPKLLN